MRSLGLAEVAAHGDDDPSPVQFHETWYVGKTPFDRGRVLDLILFLKEKGAISIRLAGSHLTIYDGKDGDGRRLTLGMNQDGVLLKLKTWVVGSSAIFGTNWAAEQPFPITPTFLFFRSTE